MSMVIMIKGCWKPNSPTTVESLNWSNAKGIQMDLRTLQGRRGGAAVVAGVGTLKNIRSNQNH